MNEELNETKIPDGIEKCEDVCRCGGNLRLHTHTFRPKNKPPKTRYYVDCEKHCGCVSEWHDSVDEAISAFDAEFGDENKIVSEAHAN